MGDTNTDKTFAISYYPYEQARSVIISNEDTKRNFCQVIPTDDDWSWSLIEFYNTQYVSYKSITLLNSYFGILNIQLIFNIRRAISIIRYSYL